MAKFYAQVVNGYRITIDRDTRKVLGIRIGDMLEVEVKKVKPQEEQR